MKQIEITPGLDQVLRELTNGEIGLTIEVSEATLERDRNFKGRLYARARLPVYWIANLIDKQIEVYTDPAGGKTPHYRNRQDHGLDDRIPLVIQGKILARIPVKEMLPP